jgi:hypothetical protein
VLPSAPQVAVETVTGGWQFTSFETRSAAPPSGLLAGAPTQPLQFVADGATVFRRELVPTSARRMTVWTRSLTSAPDTMPQEGGRVAMFTRPGSWVVMTDSVPAAACTLDASALSPYRACSEWKQLTLDVTALRGQALYLEVSSSRGWFFNPLSDAFLIGEPAFDSP